MGCAEMVVFEERVPLIVYLNNDGKLNISNFAKISLVMARLDPVMTGEVKLVRMHYHPKP